ncbi:unnamed protein product [Agarophyton chilense]
MALYVRPRSALPEPTAQDMELASALVSMKTGLRARVRSTYPVLSSTACLPCVPPADAPPPSPSDSRTRAACVVAVPYDAERRQRAIERYRRKRLRRTAGRATSIRYQIRKKLADTRPRFRGRFYKVSGAHAGGDAGGTPSALSACSSASSTSP